MIRSKPFPLRGKWCIRWSDETGRRCRRVFDKHADAEHMLAVELARVKEVKRGVRLGVPPDRTFDQLCDYWIEHRVPKKRSGYHDESIIRAHLRPSFGELLLRKIGVTEVDRFNTQRAHLHKKTLANLLTLLISMLNLAKDLGWLLALPKIKKPKIRVFDRDFSYLKTQDEIARFLKAAFEVGELVGVLYATAVYTGLREGELAGLRWPKVNFETRLITVDRSFDGPTKNEEVRYVPMLDPLLPLLRAWRLKCPGTLLFPTVAGTMHQRSARVFQEVLHEVLEAAEFPKVERNGKTRRYIVFHDTRHTFASHWMLGGGDIFKLQKILGHQSVQMTMRYAHLAPAAYATDHARLGAAIPTTGGTVVQFPAPPATGRN